MLYSNQDDNTKRFKTCRYYFPNDVIKNHNVIIKELWNNFYDQPIDSHIKPSEDKKNFTLEKGEVYTKGCLLDYEYTKNHVRLTSIDLSRQKRISCWSKSNSANTNWWSIKKSSQFSGFLGIYVCFNDFSFLTET